MTITSGVLTFPPLFMILLCLMLCPIESGVTEAMYGLPRVVDKTLLWCQCNVIPVSTLKKPRGQ
jgi:hypothetical protein